VIFYCSKLFINVTFHQAFGYFPGQRDHRLPLAGTKLNCFVTEAHRSK